MNDDDLGFAVTPFDPTRGIRFKYGYLYMDRNRQLDSFQRVTGYTLPADFLEMIGDYCEGGFAGHYRVYFHDGCEIQWHHLLLMKEADEHYTFGHETISLLRARRKLFADANGLSLFPFGEAYAFRAPDSMCEGYLAFDVRHGNAVVFVSDNGGERIEIARSFRDMMLGSYFLSYG